MDKSDKKKERQFDPELLKKGLRCDLDQYDMLKRCSDKKDMTEWNEWREKHPREDILLEGGPLQDAWLQGAHMEGVSLREAHLERAKLYEACLKGAKLRDAHLEGAKLIYADLQGACLDNTHLQGTDFRMAIVNGSTLISECKVDRHTDFRGVGLGSCRIDSGTKQLLEYNIRRKNWEDWYKVGPWWEKIPERLFVQPFWWMSNYGRSVSRIVACFFGLAVLFALVYWLWPSCVMVNEAVGDIRGFWHVLYFSVVTMTTLGFGDIAANPESWWGQTLLMLQVILGYVLLGALITRFAVLFMAGGPAGKFEEQKKKVDSVSPDKDIRGQALRFHSGQASAE